MRSCESLNEPLVGFKPTTLLKAAGTRPEPAVSVPKEKVTWPEETTTPPPELRRCQCKEQRNIQKEQYLEPPGT